LEAGLFARAMSCFAGEMVYWEFAGVDWLRAGID
jgi:hypothetical protein